MSNTRNACRNRLFTPLLLLAASLACQQSVAQKAEEPAQTEAATSSRAVPAPGVMLPKEFPEWADDEKNPMIDGRPVTIIPQIQNQIQRFVKNGSMPISAVVVTEVKTGKILAMVQGKHPDQWGAETHSALHTGFPAASLFKTVVTAAGFEISNLNPEASLSMFGGCARVNARGLWPNTESHRANDSLSLRRAYGHSCNGFFAKLAVNNIGLGPILNMGHRLGWNDQTLASDFHLPPSPLKEPNPTVSSLHTIGKFAAGFGSVGISAVHAAWQYMVIANDGVAIPVHLFADTPSRDPQKDGVKAIEKETATNLRHIMDSTVVAGTASSAFRRGRLRLLRSEVGGKTGTLTGSHPQGLTTLFVGIYPLENPEISVAAVVMLENLWKFKASNLAAEAIMAYHDYKAGAASAAMTARKVYPVETTR